MSEYYTSINRLGNNILYRGYGSDGKRVSKRIEFSPTLFVLAEQKETGWTDIYGNPVIPMQFDTMREASDFITRMKDVSNAVVLGNRNYVAQFAHEVFKHEVEWKMPNVMFWDIETLPTDKGYSEAHLAEGKISAVAIVENDGNCFTFSYDDYNHRFSREGDFEVTKYVYANEQQMLMALVKFIEKRDYDVWTGWNSNSYDNVYVITRVSKLLGEAVANLLSPWRKIVFKQKMVDQNVRHSVEIFGVEQLDYMELFDKFGAKFESLPNKKLETIAQAVLGRGKLDYSEYKSLKDMYEKNFQKYMEYNILDTRLVWELEQSLGYIKMCVTSAYSAKVNYSDELSTIPAWDSIIYGELLSRNIAVPLESNVNHREYPGGYQKDLIKGMHRDVVVFDVEGLYPATIMQFNISPETYVRYVDDVYYIDPIRSYVLSEKTDYGLSEGECICAAGHVFNTKKKGFIPELLERFRNMRIEYKAKMKAIEAQMERVKEEMKSRGIEY